MSSATSATPLPAGAAWRWLVPAGVAVVLSWWLSDFPVASVWLGVLLTTAAALVIWRPVLLFTVVAAAMPVLDLAPWSGRRLFDEFDALLLLCAALAWARLPRTTAAVHSGQTRPPQVRREGATVGAMALMLAAVAVSGAMALWPWPMADLDDPGNPLSRFNAVRLAKAALEATLMWRIARRQRAAGASPAAAFGLGMVLGLAGEVVAIVAERMAFTWLLDFSSEYRVAGSFSPMALGGAYVECFLAVATPFLLVRLLPPVRWPKLVAGAVLLAGASYALMVTYSRGGYLAMAIALAVVLLAQWTSDIQRGARAAGAAMMVILAGAVAYPVLAGSYAQSRLETVSADLGTRERHWAESLGLVGDAPLHVTFGIGLGRYAEANFWEGATAPKERLGSHRLVPDGEGGLAVRLGSGWGHYVDQIISLTPGARYRVSWRMRGRAPVADVMICQKWSISSLECAQPVPGADGKLQTSAGERGWVLARRDFIAPAAGPGWLPRPLRLSFDNAGADRLELGDISVVGEDGAERVSNGSFARGFDHWTFTSDQHMVWHAKSMLVGLYIELGAFGVLAAGLLLLAGTGAAMREALAGSPHAVALLAALLAFSTVGMIDTLVDAPRFLWLWMMLCTLPTLPGRIGVPPSLRR